VLTIYAPVVVRLSAPSTTPPSKVTAMMDVYRGCELCCRSTRSVALTYAEVDFAILESVEVWHESGHDCAEGKGMMTTELRSKCDASAGKPVVSRWSDPQSIAMICAFIQ
jgi:hypothetical protein